MGMAWNALEEREQVDFVEQDVETIFVSGVAYADVIDGLAYVTYFCEQPGPRGTEHVFRVRLVMPELAIVGARKSIDTAREKNKMAWSS